MRSERFTIKNRHGLKLVLQVDTPDNPENLAFMCHGRGGFMHQKHIEAFAQAFVENNFRTVRFDATNSIGESEGSMMNITVTNYLEDLEDVIGWARKQEWFTQPFALAGHSMGAKSATLYAQKHPGEILCLIPTGATINYELLEQAEGKEYMADWRSKGYIVETSRSKPGVVSKVGWGLMEDVKKYDLLKEADKLTMPVFMMVGQHDKPAPYEHQELLFKSIPSENKKLVKIANAEHSFRNNKTKEHGKELQEAKAALSSWLRELKQNRL